MRPIICRTLSHEFRLHTSHQGFHEALRFMEIAPELPDFDLETVDIEVLERNGFCSALLPGGIHEEGSPSWLISALHELIFHDLEASQPDAIFVHGAAVFVGGRRILLIGHKGSGKTTLTLYLLGRGHAVEGDEHLLVRTADVVARPRTLRVKPGTLALLPGLAAQMAEAPFVESWDGTPIRALSPSIGGKRWLVRPGQLDAIVFLTANHGGRSVLGSLPPDQALRRLMGEVVRWPVNIAVAATRLRALLKQVDTAELLLGDLAGAEWHLRKRFAS